MKVDHDYISLRKCCYIFYFCNASFKWLILKSDICLWRYLENSGCVGQCVNMCKIPTQDFFTNEFGLPLTMIPSKILPLWFFYQMVFHIIINCVKHKAQHKMKMITNITKEIQQVKRAQLTNTHILTSLVNNKAQFNMKTTTKIF